MVKLENIPSHNMESKYALLVEKSLKSNGYSLVFLKMEGNEKHLYQLSSQISEIDWSGIEGNNYVNIFSLDVDNLVSAETAKEMTNIIIFNKKARKFDGRLKKIDFNFSNFDSKYTKICKVNDLLKNNHICKYIDDEDILTDYDDDSSYFPYPSSSNSGDEGSGSSDEGSSDEGSSDEGSGSSDEGSSDEGSSDEGSSDEGSSDEGSSDEGSSDEGSVGIEGSSDEGSVGIEGCSLD